MNLITNYIETNLIFIIYKIISMIIVYGTRIIKK